jgi:hypothetical protein
MTSILFDMTYITILGTAKNFEDLQFEEDEYPPQWNHIRSFRTDKLDSSTFLGASVWTELNLRKLYTWLKIQPPLTPAKISLLELRTRIRTGIAAALRLEPSNFPTLGTVAVTVSVPALPRPSKPPAANRGSVGPIIHRVATEMWKAAGKPRDPGVILQLRRQIMTALNDEHKIKTSTSSNELGRWQKEILALVDQEI